MITTPWRKSSYSGNENACTELAIGTEHTHVRDSKNPASGTLTFPAGHFQQFLTSIKPRLG